MAEAWNTLWAARDETLAEWARLQADADAHRDVERESANSIQRLFRGQRVRAWISTMRAACVEIARVYRGHRGAVVARTRADARAQREEMAVFHYYAADCQRAFRGYYSRRYKHDFSARKAYIESVVAQGTLLRAQLAQQFSEQQSAEEAAAQQAKMAQFKLVTQQLHHLVSTKSIPGVYNSPYDQEAPICAMGVPVETHLCSGVKDLLKLRDYARPPLGVDLNGTRRLDLPFHADAFKSLQAASPYDAPLEAQRMAAKIGRVGFVGAADMQCGQRVKYAPYRRGVNEGSAYFDHWKNPYTKRGIPRTKEDLMISVSGLGKAPDVHFYTSVGGNRSTVHANGIFDVIRAAEKTGGVTRRHLALQAGNVTHSNDVVDAGYVASQSARAAVQAGTKDDSTLHFGSLDSTSPNVHTAHFAPEPHASFA
ncbi:hypothetical protein M885DRAFT_478248 [Pelagophyceae sp. CCMP2097]|nr:hypothetical protein M885DRAFT_478248 [Pelagophyceae sp. CCMP2097]|mmetsp:Transcript_4424/g.13958  ORF Transcript_4424/g.13958 Transcript_4424/m.13958 type:complete len:425 (+) Transcript_4424:200-1474(+)